MKVKYVDFCFGMRIGNTIYLHKNLKKYPKLHKAILKHELNHTGKFKLDDILMDIRCEELKNLKGECYRFILRNPKSLLQMLPIMRIEKKWSIDPSLTLLYILILVLIFISLRM